MPLAASADEAVVPGHFVLARASQDALILFDASPEVAAIVSNKTSDADANDGLERDALKVLATLLPKLDQTTKSVTVRVTYNKTGAVSPSTALRRSPASNATRCLRLRIKTPPRIATNGKNSTPSTPSRLGYRSK